MTMPPALLYFEDEQAFAANLAQAAGLNALPLARHRFPDGEISLRLPRPLPERVVLLRSLHNPNEKLLELLLAGRAARLHGARHLTLVAPYLAYMRQDAEFTPGEVVSQRIVGHFLADLFDAVITVDPHLHRVATLAEAIPSVQAIAPSAAPALGELIARQRQRPLLVGPDEESAQWVAAAAAAHGLEHAVCRKTRHSDHVVDILLPDGVGVAGRQVVLLDDVASTGETLAGAARLLLQAGATSVDVAVTHALFAGDALALIQQAGVDEVWSTDCIRHATNAVSVASTIAQALRQVLQA